MQAGLGVGLGVGVGVGQTQVDSPVQLGFRQAPSLHTIVLGQSALFTQLVPHCGTGVGVGVGATVKDMVQEVASGCDSGAVGAIGVCTDVRRVMTTTANVPTTRSAAAIASMVLRFKVIYLPLLPLRTRLTDTDATLDLVRTSMLNCQWCGEIIGRSQGPANFWTSIK